MFVIYPVTLSTIGYPGFSNVLTLLTSNWLKLRHQIVLQYGIWECWWRLQCSHSTQSVLIFLCSYPLTRPEQQGNTVRTQDLWCLGTAPILSYVRKADALWGWDPVGCLFNGNHREGTQPQNFLVLSSNLTVRCSMSFNLLDTSIKPKPEFWVFVPCLVFSSTVPYLPNYTWYLLHFKCRYVCCFGVFRQNQIHM